MIESGGELSSDDRRGPCLGRGWAGCDDQLVVDNLADHVSRQLQELVVRGRHSFRSSKRSPTSSWRSQGKAILSMAVAVRAQMSGLKPGSRRARATVSTGPTPTRRSSWSAILKVSPVRD